MERDHRELTECPVCLCPNEGTGSLGRLVHYLCQACGIWYHTEVERDSYERADA